MNLIIGGILIIILFLAVREIITWYWKLNEMVDLLEKIEKNTRPKFAESSQIPKAIPAEGGYFTDRQPLKM